jgi:hypothetical protein
MYEYDWEEYDSNGLRYYLDRVLIESDEELPYDQMETMCLDRFNLDRRNEEIDEYDLDQVVFDIIELKHIKKIEVRNIK